VLLAAGGAHASTLSTAPPPLRLAVEAGRRELIPQLLEQPTLLAQWTSASGGESLVHWAARIGDAKLLALMLRKGLSPTAADASGATPLHVANDLEIVSLLASFGARADAQDNEGVEALTAIHDRLRQQALPWMGDYLAAKADFEEQKRLKEEAAAANTAAAADQPESEEGEEEALEWVDPRTPEMLEDEANFEKLCKEITTTLADAAKLLKSLYDAVEKKDSVKVNNFVTKKGAVVHARCGPNLMTPLQIAAGKGDFKVLQLVLKLGGTKCIDATEDKTGSTAAHMACKGGYEKVATELAQQKADFRLRDREGMSALQRIAEPTMRAQLRELTFVAAGRK